ncbi:50S ribosomal protein L19 [Candidatus Babeliales bacterium]|nr:50S ribosomal protein L19 [Candidatus Babeliales bacterium]
MKANHLTKETIVDYGVKNRNFPEFKIGDTIEVAQKVTEGAKTRIQMFQGIVIVQHSNGIASTFTVRKIASNNIGVERIFPYYSENITEITVVKRGRVRRAKLTYLRGRVGRATNVQELILTKDEKAVISARDAAARTAKAESEAVEETNVTE